MHSTATRRRKRPADRGKRRVPAWAVLTIGGLLGSAAGVVGATISDPEVGFPAWVDLTGLVAGSGLGLLAAGLALALLSPGHRHSRTPPAP
jgi:hypothetical protein